MKGLAIGGGFAAAALLSGCADTARPATPAMVTPPAARMTGVERLMGLNAAALTQMFGAPDADMREGAARKLQFQSSVCVLDTYLYPGHGKEPEVTYVDARQTDGSPIDRASCAAALERRRGGK